MADNVSKKRRSEIMRSVKGKNTGPEMVVRKFLFSKGFRFRIHDKDLPGKPDIKLTKYKTVIFVNGCFWHGHDNCKIYVMPKTNKDFWRNKIERNMERDRDNIAKLKKLGWNVIVVWECELKKSKRDKTLNKLLGEIKPISKSSSSSLLKREDSIGLVADPQATIQYSEKKDDLMDKKNTLNVLSLFSGCGGMDLGFEGGFSVLETSVNEILTPYFIEKRLRNGFVRLKKTRFNTVFANDILREARNAWVSFFSKRGKKTENFHVDSIVDLVKMFKSGNSVFPDNVDIVTGGFPCQDFSVAGKRNGFHSHKNHKGELIEKNAPSVETRGQLYMWMKEVIEITSPKIFIAENVKGLVNLSNVKEIIQNDFSKANGNGYIVLDPRVLHSADYGVPQSRERVFFIGIKKNELTKKALKELSKKNIGDDYNPYPKPTHSKLADKEDLKPFVSLRDVFKNLKEPEESDDLSQRFYSKAKFMGTHCQGQTEIKLSGIGPTIRAEHHGNIEFRRLSKKNGGKIEKELKKGLKERRLTPRECALIQTFPPDYEFVIENKSGGKKSYLVSPSKAYKIIGNAVPPLLAYNLARRLESLWDLYFKK